MASIQKRPNGKWRARYRDPEGKERSRHFARKVDAQRFLDEITTSMVTGMYVDPKAGKTTFKTYAEKWLKAQVYRESTAASVAQALKRIYPFIGDLPLGTITRDTVQELVAELDKTLAPATVEVTYSYVATIFKSAVQSRILQRTPCIDIKLREVIKPKVVPITTEEVEKLVEAAPPRLKAMIYLAAGTGMRMGEVFGLTVDRVEFLKRKIVVDRQLHYTGEKGYFFGPPKTASSNREIPLPDFVAGQLAAHIDRFPPNEEGLLFTGARGAPYRRGTFPWTRIAKAVDMEGFTFHGLRHHYASLLIFAGLDVKTVQTRLGHKSAQETLDTYAHLWPGTEDRTRQAVDQAFGFSPADYLRTKEVVGEP